METKSGRVNPDASQVLMQNASLIVTADRLVLGNQLKAVLPSRDGSKNEIPGAGRDEKCTRYLKKLTRTSGVRNLRKKY